MLSQAVGLRHGNGGVVCMVCCLSLPCLLGNLPGAVSPLLGPSQPLPVLTLQQGSAIAAGATLVLQSHLSVTDLALVLLSAVLAWAEADPQPSEPWPSTWYLLGMDSVSSLKINYSGSSSSQKTMTLQKLRFSPRDDCEDRFSFRFTQPPAGYYPSSHSYSPQTVKFYGTVINHNHPIATYDQPLTICCHPSLTHPHPSPPTHHRPSPTTNPLPPLTNESPPLTNPSPAITIHQPTTGPCPPFPIGATHPHWGTDPAPCADGKVWPNPVWHCMGGCGDSACLCR